MQQDQMILNWINGFPTTSILVTVACKRCTRATWEALKQRYASLSQNHIFFFLRNELLQSKKCELFVAEYLDKMNAIANNLAIAGKHVDDDELIQIILNNLGPAFEMTVNTAQACDTPITYPILEALLLTIEMMMEQTILHVESAHVNAFIAAIKLCGRSHGTRRGGFSSNCGGNNPRIPSYRNNYSYQRAPGGIGD